MLPVPYKEALQALKDQATAAISRMTSAHADQEVKRAQLRDAQRRMALHEQATKDIVRALMRTTDQQLTILTLTEERLVKELGASYLAKFELADNAG